MMKSSEINISFIESKVKIGVHMYWTLTTIGVRTIDYLYVYANESERGRNSVA